MCLLLPLDRLICHFGFDWVVVPRVKDGVKDGNFFKELQRIGSVRGCLVSTAEIRAHQERQNSRCLVRRRTCVASILKLDSTKRLHTIADGALPWDSTTPLLHRRTVILFNELHSDSDGLRFKEWLANSDLVRHHLLHGAKC